MDEDAPVKPKMLGDTLKLRYKADREGSWIAFNPANVHVELNGVPLTLLQELTLHLNVKSFAPTVTLKMALTDIDIDVDTLIALEAFVKSDKESLMAIDMAIDEARGHNDKNKSEERNAE